jgi:hypothetical protein
MRLWNDVVHPGRKEENLTVDAIFRLNQYVGPIRTSSDEPLAETVYSWFFMATGST